MFSSFVRLLQSLFYPHGCPGCGEEVREPGVLCGRCREKIWHPRSFHPESLGCPHVDGLFFLLDYAGAIQKALWMAKFRGRDDLLPRLGMAPGPPPGTEVCLGIPAGGGPFRHRHPHGP